MIFILCKFNINGRDLNAYSRLRLKRTIIFLLSSEPTGIFFEDIKLRNGIFYYECKFNKSNFLIL